jgi:hypothetical protein
MQTETSQKTTLRTTPTMRVTEPAYGSDEYMVARGYQPVTEEEQADYGRFVVHRPGLLTLALSAFRLWLFRHATQQSETRVVLKLLRTEESNLEPLHARELLRDTSQNELTLTYRFQQ